MIKINLLFFVLCCQLAVLARAQSYQNITSQSGIEMTHTATLMSTGIAIADFDNNGYPDLFFTGFDDDAGLYFNQGDGSFVANDNIALPDLTGASCGSTAAADFNNDGWQDIYVACRGNNYLLMNMAGNGFNDITGSSGTNHPERSESVAWGDINKDGWLDLFVGVHPTGFPVDYNNPNDFDHIFINNGNLTFTNIQSSINLVDINRATLASIMSDFDFDGDLDVYIANDKNQQNAFLANNGEGCMGWCFENLAIANGSQVPAFSMGIAVADYDNDGDWDMSYSSISEHIFLKNNGSASNPQFSEQAVNLGIQFDNGSGWGTLMFDANNDGWEDLFLATGQGFPTASNLFYLNNKNGTFTESTDDFGLVDFNRTHAAAWIDFDKDGDLDLVYGRFNQDYQLLENFNNSGNWIVITFEGALDMNRDAIGTKVFLTAADGTKMIRELRSGESRGSNNQKVIHFGLAQNPSADVKIVWPNGAIRNISDIVLNQYHHFNYVDHDPIFDSSFE